MTTSIHTGQVEALHRAVARATLAPSVHNTQPWRFVIENDRIEIHADWTRQLHVLDPTGRQLMVSVGCALFNARVALAASGYAVQVTRTAEDPRSGPVATIKVTGNLTGESALTGLDEAIPVRQSNRRQFADEEVPAEIVERLVHAATAEGSVLVKVEREEHRLALTRLSQRADRQQILDPSYRAELRAWTTDDPRRRDGVPALAVPHVDADSGDDIPIRDFDTHGMGWLPTETRSSRDQCLLLLGTWHDTPEDWLRAGEALQRVLLEATVERYATSLLTQVIEVPATRSLLRDELDLTMNPHVLLRVGRAPLVPSSRRRPLDEVVIDHTTR